MTPNYNLPPGCTDRDIDRAVDRDRTIHDEYLPGEQFERETRNGFVVIKRKTAREIRRYAQRVNELNMLDEEMMSRGIIVGHIPFLNLTPIAYRFAPKRKLSAMEECERLEREIWREDLWWGTVTGLVIVAVTVAIVWIVQRWRGVL